MTFSFVASTKAGGTAGATSSSIDTSNAKLIVIQVAYYTGTALTVTDNKGNSYSALTPYLGGGPSYNAMYFCSLPVVGTGHTFTVSGISSSAPTFVVSAWTCTYTPVLDRASTFDSNASTTQGQFSTSSFTPIKNGALLLAFHNNASTLSTFTAGSGWTLVEFLQYSAGVNYGVGVTYKIQTTATAIPTTEATANWTPTTFSNFGGLSFVEYPSSNRTISRTIGTSGSRDYSDVSSWNADAPSDLATSNVIWEGVLYPEGPGVGGEWTPTTQYYFGGSTSNVNAYKRLRAAKGWSWSENANPVGRYDPTKGVAIRGNGNYDDQTPMSIQADFAQLVGIQIKGKNGQTAVKTWTNVSIDSCILENSFNSTLTIIYDFTRANLSVSNSILIGGLVLTSGLAQYYTNCTFFGTGQVAQQQYSGYATFTNCAIIGYTSIGAGFNGGSNNNAFIGTLTAGNNPISNLDAQNAFRGVNYKFDNFNRANSTTSLGYTSKDSLPWNPFTPANGTSVWGINSNQAYMAGSGTQAIVVTDSGASDVIVEVTVSTINSDHGIVARCSDANNYILAVAAPLTAQWALFTCIGGSFTSLSYQGSATIANGDVLRLVCVGSSIQMIVNGTLRVSGTSTHNMTATLCGLRNNNSNVLRYDNFSVLGVSNLDLLGKPGPLVDAGVSVNQTTDAFGQPRKLGKAVDIGVNEIITDQTPVSTRGFAGGRYRERELTTSPTRFTKLNQQAPFLVGADLNRTVAWTPYFATQGVITNSSGVIPQVGEKGLNNYYNGSGNYSTVLMPGTGSVPAQTMFVLFLAPANPGNSTYSQPIGRSTTSGYGVNFSWDHASSTFMAAWGVNTTVNSWMAAQYTGLVGGKWYFLAVSAKQDMIRIFLNGSFHASNTTSWGGGTLTGPWTDKLFIGSGTVDGSTNTNSFNGLVSLGGQINKFLTDEEHKLLGINPWAMFEPDADDNVYYSQRFYADAAKTKLPQARSVGTVGAIPQCSGGDLLLMAVETANEFPPTPVGWTELTSSTQGTGTAGNSAATRLTIFWKWASNSDGGASVTVLNPGHHVSASIMAFQGVNTKTPFDAYVGQIQAAASNNVVFPPLTTFTPNSLILNVGTAANSVDLLQLDYTNALAKTITHCIPFNGINKDILNGSALSLGAAGSIVNVAIRGKALQSVGAAAAASISLNLSAYTKVAISFWLYWDVFANDDALFFETSTSFFSVPGTILIDPNSGAPASGYFQIATGGSGSATASRFNRPSAAAWHHYVINLDLAVSSDTVKNVWVDGVSQTLTSVATSGSGGNFANQTLYLFSRAGTSLFGAGKVQNLLIRGGYQMTGADAASEYSNPWQIYKSAFSNPSNSSLKLISTTSSALTGNIVEPVSWNLGTLNIPGSIGTTGNTTIALPAYTPQAQALMTVALRPADAEVAPTIASSFGSRPVKTPQVWTSAPPRLTPINWNHPLAAGLVFAAVPIGNVWYDLVSGQTSVVPGQSAIRTSVDGNGSTSVGFVSATGSSGSYFKAQTGLDKITSTGTLFVEGGFEVNGTTTYSVMSRDTSTGDAFGLEWDDAAFTNNGLALYLNNAFAASTITVPNVLGVNSELYIHRVAVSIDGTTANFYAKRKIPVTLTGTYAANANSNRRTVMGGAWTGGSVVTDRSTNNVTFAWNRVLTLQEYQMLHDNPWQLFAYEDVETTRTTYYNKFYTEDRTSNVAPSRSTVGKINNRWRARGLVGAFIRTGGAIVDALTNTPPTSNTAFNTYVNEAGLTTYYAGGLKTIFAHKPEYAVTGPITIIAGIKPLSFTYYCAIINKEPHVTTYNAYEFRTNTAGNLTLLRSGGSAGSYVGWEGGTPVPLNKRSIVAVRSTANLTDTTPSFWVNGIKTSVATAGGGGSYTVADDGSSNVTIGGRYDSGTWQEGSIDFIWLFNGALTDDEVLSLTQNPYQVFDAEDAPVFTGRSVATSMLTTEREAAKQPITLARINWQNPITNGLKFVIAGGSTIPVLGRATPTAPKAALAGTSGYVGHASTSATLGITDVDITISGSGYSMLSVPVFKTLNAQQTLIDDDTGGGGGPRRFQFRLGEASPNAAELIAFDTLGNPYFAQYTVASSKTLRPLPMVGVVRNNTAILFTDNVKTTAAIGGTAATPTTSWRIGASKTGNYSYQDGAILISAGWDRALTDEEAMSLQRNPWQLFEGGDDVSYTSDGSVIIPLGIYDIFAGGQDRSVQEADRPEVASVLDIDTGMGEHSVVQIPGAVGTGGSETSHTFIR